MQYTAIFEAQPDGGYHASCPALPGCHSEGDTLDESIANIREAITVHLESLQAPPGYYYKLKVRPVGVGPAWDIGDPKQITDWALSRTDSHSIRNAIVTFHALAEREG